MNKKPLQLGGNIINLKKTFITDSIINIIIFFNQQATCYTLYNHTILSLNDSRLHLIQVLFDTQLFVLDHFLLLVYSFLDLLAHHLESQLKLMHYLMLGLYIGFVTYTTTFRMLYKIIIYHFISITVNCFIIIINIIVAWFTFFYSGAALELHPMCLPFSFLPPAGL